MSPDGATIITKRQLHKTVLESIPGNVPSGSSSAGGYPTHIPTDLSEDTDVLPVLTRQPRMPEIVAASSKSRQTERSRSLSSTDSRGRARGILRVNRGRSASPSIPVDSAPRTAIHSLSLAMQLSLWLHDRLTPWQLVISAAIGPAGPMQFFCMRPRQHNLC